MLSTTRTLISAAGRTDFTWQIDSYCIGDAIIVGIYLQYLHIFVTTRIKWDTSYKYSKNKTIILL